MNKLLIELNGKSYFVSTEHQAAVEQLQAQLTEANEKNKRLRDEIQARRQWQTCPSCSKTFATDSGR